MYELNSEGGEKIMPEIEPTAEELQIIAELRKISWGKLTIIKKGGKVTMITPAQDIRLGK